jgi:hypothetical protein
LGEEAMRPSLRDGEGVREVAVKGGFIYQVDRTRGVVGDEKGGGVGEDGPKGAEFAHGKRERGGQGERVRFKDVSEEGSGGRLRWCPVFPRAE